jgi:hypothetical protein
MNSIPLAKFAKANHQIVAKIGMKSIMRVSTPRLVSWYLVLPAVGDGDAKCMLLDKVKKIHTNGNLMIKQEACIIREETARATARLA